MYNHHIDSFIAVVNCGSFNKAGELFHMTPASMSKHIDDLETILGVKLLIRKKTGITLTAPGKLFFEECHRLIQLSEEIKAHTRNEEQPDKKPIIIGTSPLISLSRFNQICAASPAIRKYKFRMVPYGESINHNVSAYSNASNSPEISVGGGKSITDFPETDFIAMEKAKLTCVVPASHALARKKTLSTEDLKGETLLFPSRGNADLAQNFLLKMRERCPEIKVEIPPIFYDLDLINSCAVEKRMLVGFDIWDNIHPGLVNLPVDWDFETEYGLIWRKDARKEVQDFIKAFRKALSEQKGK